MENTKTIGEMVGVVRHTCSTKNDAGERVQTTIKIDFSSASDDDIKSWLTSNRVIAGQRVWRTLSVDEIKSTVDGGTFMAQHIGRKIRSERERIADYVNAGIPENIAKMMVRNPEKANEIFKSVDVDENE